MELSEFKKLQEATTYDSITILARAILLDKVYISSGRIRVSAFDPNESKA